MIARPDHKTLEAMAGLDGSRDWEQVRSWLEESLRAVDEALRHELQEPRMRQLQGMALAVNEILQLQQGAKAAIAAQR